MVDRTFLCELQQSRNGMWCGKRRARHIHVIHPRVVEIGVRHGSHCGDKSKSGLATGKQRDGHPDVS